MQTMRFYRVAFLRALATRTTFSANKSALRKDITIARCIAVYIAAPTRGIMRPGDTAVDVTSTPHRAEIAGIAEC